MTVMPIEKQDIDLSEFEDPEYGKYCELLLWGHNAEIPCGNPAEWRLSLVIPECGHLDELYLCEDCRTEFMVDPDYVWVCTQDNNHCGIMFRVIGAIVNMERIK